MWRSLIFVVVALLGSSCQRTDLTRLRNAVLPWVEQVTGDASPDDPLPLVVTLHGRGSDPERFQKFFEDLDVPVRIAHLQAPVAEHDGRAWFTFRGKSRDRIRDEIDLLADAAVRTTERILASRQTLGKPVVTGFSQGAMVVYSMALRHHDRFAKALPVSGVLMNDPPPEMDGPAMPKVVALHGMRDPIIGPSASRRAVATLEKMGVNAELKLFPDAVHWIDGELKAALHAELRP